MRALAQRKEAEATAKRGGHIDAVLARRRGEYQSEMASEARRQEEHEERKRKREEERRLEREREDEEKRGRKMAALAGPDAQASAAPVDAVAESAWDRMMNGGGKKKKKKKRRQDDEQLDETSFEASGGGARDDISVAETNRLRESLGLKPLRE